MSRTTLTISIDADIKEASIEILKKRRIKVSNFIEDKLYDLIEEDKRK